MGIGKGRKEVAVGTLGLVGGALGEVAALKGGGWMVVWTNFADPFSGATKDDVLTSIAGRAIDAGGRTEGKAFEVNRSAEFQQLAPEIATTDKGVLVAWWNITIDGRGNEVEAQPLSAKGRRIGKELTLSRSSEDDQSRPDLTVLDSGRVLAVWEDGRDAEPGFGAAEPYARQITAKGRLKGESVLFEADVLTPSVEALKGGRIAVAYDDLAEIVVRTSRLDGRGAVEHRLGELVDDPQVVALKKGGFVVVWETLAEVAANGNARFDGTIVAQRFDKAGGPVGKPIAVPKRGAGDEADFDAAPLGKGFAVAWTDTDGDGLGIRLRAFDARGRPVGKEIGANRTEEGDQSEPFLAASKGRLLVGWTDASGTGGRAPSEIVTRVFKLKGDARKGREDPDAHLVGTEGDDALKGGRGGDLLEGLGGDDRLRGGAGWDVFAFAPGAGSDVIEDWRDGRDRIEIAGARFRDLRIEDAGGDAVIRFADVEIRVEDAEAAAFGRDDFAFV